MIELNDIQIVSCDKHQPHDLLKVTFRCSYSNDLKFKIKQTPNIMDDHDTQSYLKYFLHGQLKKHIFDDFSHEQMMPVKDFVHEFEASNKL